MSALGEAGNEPHVFILDINGEYGSAFPPPHAAVERKPDRIYLNGGEFSLPLWFFNAAEICAWLSASEQTQEPVLKDWWALAKAQSANKAVANDANSLRHALAKAQDILAALNANKPRKKACVLNYKIIQSYIGDRKLESLAALRKAVEPYKELLKSNAAVDWDPPINELEIRTATEKLMEEIKVIVAARSLLRR